MNKKNILIVSHDAGGAEILSSWVKANPDSSYSFLLEGPAKKIFESKGNLKNVLDRGVLKSLSAFDMVLTGTSWASDLEKQTLKAALDQRVFVASFLDNWVNYQERFNYHGQAVLPNEIWVGDAPAEVLAKKVFPKVLIVLKSNIYLDEMVEKVKKESLKIVRERKGTRVLYVTEPTSRTAEALKGNPRAMGYIEQEALEATLRYYSNQGQNIQALRIRLHPAEPQGKYDTVVAPYKNKLPIEISAGNDLLADCAWADWIVGCESMVMAIGVFAGKKVFCSIPADGVPPRLPFPDIERLFPAKQRVNP